VAAAPTPVSTSATSSSIPISSWRNNCNNTGGSGSVAHPSSSAAAAAVAAAATSSLFGRLSSLSHHQHDHHHAASAAAATAAGHALSLSGLSPSDDDSARKKAKSDTKSLILEDRVRLPNHFLIHITND
jgi:hypothetical protein